MFCVQEMIKILCDGFRREFSSESQFFCENLSIFKVLDSEADALLKFHFRSSHVEKLATQNPTRCEIFETKSNFLKIASVRIVHFKNAPKLHKLSSLLSKKN